MAKIIARDGVLKVGAATVASVISITEDEQCSVVDSSDLADQELTYIAGDITRTYQVECNWDKADATGQGALDVGVAATIVYQPEGDTTGDETRSISAVVTSVSTANAKGAMVTKSIGLQGSGAKTVGTAA